MKRTPLKKSNKPLKRSAIKRAVKEVFSQEKKDRTAEMFDVFLAVWGSRSHYCESCGTWLGSDPRTYMFDHLLEKSIFPEFALDHENIYLCCWDCHTLKTAGHPTAKHQEAIDAYKQKNL